MKTLLNDQKVTQFMREKDDIIEQLKEKISELEKRKDIGLVEQKDETVEIRTINEK